MAKRLPLSTLRGIKLPQEKPGEPDHVTSLRMTLQFHAESRPGRVICVPDSIAAMVTTQGDQTDPPQQTDPSHQTDQTDPKPKGKK